MAEDGRVNVEREVKLDAPPDFQLPSFGGLAGVTVGAQRELVLEATYFDTSDLRLARSGVTLRYRTGEPGLPWTLKLPGGVTGKGLVRQELDFDGSLDAPPPDAIDLVRARLRSRAVEPAARIRCARNAITLVDVAGDALIEIADDRVVATRGHETHEFREIEIELKADGDDALRALADAIDRLRAAGCRSGASLPKLVRALGPAALAPAAHERPASGSDSAAIDLVRNALGRSVGQLISHDAGVRLGGDPEDVHQFRVATRRLRSDLRTFATMLDRAWVDDLRARLSAVASLVGEVRDADVLEERLQRHARVLSVVEQSGVTQLLGILSEQRDRARASLLDVLRASAYDRLLDDLELAVAAPRISESSTHDEASNATRLARKLVRKRWRRLDAAVRALGEDPSDESLHWVRIRAKQCRYAAEAVVPVLGAPARRLAKAAASIQSVLGDLHDSVVAEGWIRDAATQTNALAAGALIGIQRVERDRARHEWPGTWKAASKNRLRRWL